MDEATLQALLPMPEPNALPRVPGLTEAYALGYTRHAVAHRVANGRWRRVLPHTYLTVDTMTWLDRLRAALAFAGGGGTLSGAAALTVDFRSVRRPTSVLVLRPGMATSRTTEWVRVRQTPRLPERLLGPGPPRSDVARAIADFAVEQRRLDNVRTAVAR